MGDIVNIQEDKEIQVLCKNIYDLRKYYRLTQKEMAIKLGIGVGSLRMLEHGRIPERMTCDTIFKISIEFKIPVKALFYPLHLTESITGEEK